jgi:hypothetical protein
MYEFGVDGINPDGLVIGRNGDLDIPLGTTFTAIRLTRFHPGADEYRSEDLGVVGHVALTLREVHWYQRTIDVVPAAHSAGLRVAGDGLALLNGLLQELPPHHSLSLTAPEPHDPKTGQALSR